MKKTIRLTECELHQMIGETVKRIISEMDFKDYSDRLGRGEKVDMGELTGYFGDENYDGLVGKTLVLPRGGQERSAEKVVSVTVNHNVCSIRTNKGFINLNKRQMDELMGSGSLINDYGDSRFEISIAD